VLLAAAAWWRPAPAVRRRLPLTVAVAAGAALVAALPTLLSATTFLRVSSNSLATVTVGSSPLGQLQRPLDALQMAGVWLSEGYGYPVSGQIEWRLTQVLAWLVVLAAVGATVLFLRRRTPGPVPLLVAGVLTAAIVAPRASPYADAKLLALACPTVVFAALCGALALRGRWRLPGVAAASVAGLAVLASAAFAYHGVRVAPVPRLKALEETVAAVQDKGWILLDEVEEFGKYYGRNAPHLNMAFESITPRQAQPQGGGYHLDVDQLLPDYVQSFDVVITRKGPSSSRPPANFRRIYANRWYEAWERGDTPRVVAHLGLGDVLHAGAQPTCAQLRKWARGAPAGTRLVAASAPEVAELDIVDAPDRPIGWPPLAAPPGVVEPHTPGVVEDELAVDGGRYDVWIRASTGRPVDAVVDGRRTGTANALNTQGQWQPAGSVELSRGRHEVALKRPGGGPAPGDGAPSALGPVALVRQEERGVRELPPSRVDELCGGRWDWIEIVKG